MKSKALLVTGKNEAGDIIYRETVMHGATTERGLQRVIDRITWQIFGAHYEVKTVEIREDIKLVEACTADYAKQGAYIF